MFGHAIVLLVAAGMVGLGLWQLDRLHQRQDRNERTRHAMAAQPLQLASANIPPNVEEYRRVRVVGHLDPTHAVYVRGSWHDGAPGYAVLEPLQLPGGALLVNRGWISRDDGDGRSLPELTTQAQVTVEGLLRRSERGAGITSTNHGVPPVPTVGSVDLRSIEPLAGARLSSMWLQQTAPVTAGGPVPLDLPELSEGPHRSYALQWFSFSVIAVVGWCALLRRAWRDEQEAAGTAGGTPRP